MPGFGKDLNVLGRYTKAASKFYIDTLTGLRGTVIRYIPKNKCIER